MNKKSPGRKALFLVPALLLGFFPHLLYSVDSNSLRIAKQSPAAVLLSWSDPTPTNFCIYRDTALPMSFIVAQTGSLSCSDTPPAASLLYYGVDEPPSGVCNLAYCIADYELVCGSSERWNNGGFGNTDAINVYPSCIDWDESGPEYTFWFSPDQDQSVQLSLASILNLDLFVLEEKGSGCNPSTCFAYGDQSVQFNAAGGSTYYVVVDGFQGAVDDFTLNLSCGPCLPASPVTCAASENGSNGDPGSTRVIDMYASCTDWMETGPEYTYSFAATADEVVRATLSNLTADLNLFILEDQGGGCDSFQCIAYDFNDVRFRTVPGRTYYIVVDGYLGDVGSYTLDVACGPPRCEPQLALACGDSDAYNNGGPGSTDLLDDYPACINWNEAGPEYTYTFSTPANSTVTAGITTANGNDLDLFILEDLGTGCDPATCFAYGGDTVQFNAAAGTTYYIVVDGYFGAVDDYTLTVTCQ